MTTDATIPWVSVITPGWNGAGFVHRLLDSLVAQTYPHIEYIYVDDGSTDGTRDVVLSYQERFEQAGMTFRYVRKENGGLSSAINAGLKLFTGEYLCWPEYDDFLSPDSIAKRVAFLESHPDYSVVASDAWVYDENDMKKPRYRLGQRFAGRFDTDQFVHRLLGETLSEAGVFMVRAADFLATHPDRTILDSRLGVAYQMMLPLYYHRKSGFIEEPLFHYVVRSESISHRKRTLEEQVAMVDEFFSVACRTLQTIPMEGAEREGYVKLAEYRRTRSKLSLAYRYGDDALFAEQYRHLQAAGRVTFADRFRCLRTRYPAVEAICSRLETGRGRRG